MLSDGKSTALVLPDGEIDWWEWPRMDSPPLCWSLLGGDGGAARWVDAEHAGFDDQPAGPTARTTLRLGGRLLESWDALLACDDGSDLVRLVRGTDADLDITHELRVGGFDQAWVTWDGAHAKVDGHDLWLAGGETVVRADGTAVTQLRAPKGAWAVLLLSAHEAVHDPELLIERLVAAEGAHRSLLDEASVPRRHAERARHALAVLEACTDRDTGAVIASPTTSLPEVVGGDRQFDYRYSWLRDSSVAITVASLLGRRDAAARYMEFLEALGPDAILESPVRTVDGGASPEEREVADVEGWCDSRPVRVGNAAGGQLQYDAIGYVVDAIFVHVRKTRLLTGETWAIVRTLADRAAAHDGEPSNGIWELRQPSALVSADIGRWLALDRALRIARRHRPLFRHRRAWKQARAGARDRVLGALRPDGTLPQAYGADRIDASALLLVTFRLLPSRDPRAARLVDATVRALGSGPLLHRYPPDGADGFSPGEAPFVPASWWAVTALAVLGRPEAYDRADQLCTILPALQPEEFDPARREARGNIPLVWSHAECARALFELDRQRRTGTRLKRLLTRRRREHPDVV
jgi:GH15 family glucan-1,4-alpha-glucosidase